MAPDLRSITDCEIPQPLLTPITPAQDQMVADAVERTGLGTFYGQLGHAAPVINAWMSFYQPILHGGSVSLRTKELCRLRIAARNGCMFCLGGRFRDDAGSPVANDDDLDAVLAGRFDDPRFTPLETAALTFTEAFRVDHTSVDKVLVDATLEHMSEAEFVELGICLAQFTGMGSLFAMLGIPSPVPVS